MATQQALRAQAACHWQPCQHAHLPQRKPAEYAGHEDADHPPAVNVARGHTASAIPQGQPIGSIEREVGTSECEPCLHALPLPHLHAQAPSAAQYLNSMKVVVPSTSHNTAQHGKAQHGTAKHSPAQQALQPWPTVVGSSSAAAYSFSVASSRPNAATVRMLATDSCAMLPARLYAWLALACRGESGQASKRQES